MGGTATRTFVILSIGMDGHIVGLFIPGLRFPTFCEVRSRAQITVIFTVFGRDFHDFQELNVQLSKFVSKWLRSEKKIFEILDRIFFL